MSGVLRGERPRPLVSVIIPTHNRSGLLREALDSVFAQDGVGERFQMEVLVVDDASTDDTAEIVRAYPAVRYIRLGTNRGESAARNAAIRASRGTYIAFLDDDDLWLPHKLRLQVEALERHPEAGGSYAQNQVQGDGVKDGHWPPARLAPSGDILPALLMEDDLISIDTLVVRREAFELAGCFDETLRSMQYYDMALRLARRVSFTFVPREVAVIRFSGQGAWAATVVNGVYQQTHLAIVERVLATLPDTPENTRLKRKARAGVFALTAKHLASLGERGWIGFDRFEDHVQKGLQAAPAMIREAAVRTAFQRCARVLARSSPSPLQAVEAFCTRLRAAEGPQRLRGRLWLRWLMGDVWVEIAVWSVFGGHPDSRRALAAAARALRWSPPSLFRRRMMWALLRLPLGAHGRRLWAFIMRSKAFLHRTAE